MMLAMLEGPDLLIVAVLVMLLFGAKRLPEFARGLGQAKKEFEHAQRGDTAPTPTPTPESTTTTETTTPRPALLDPGARDNNPLRYTDRDL